MDPARPTSSGRESPQPQAPPAGGSFESPFLPLLGAESGLMSEPEVEEEEDEEQASAVIAQQLRLQQQLREQQEQAMAQQQLRQRLAEAEHQRAVEGLERLRLEAAGGDKAAGAGDDDDDADGDDDDAELTAEELQQLLVARAEADEAAGARAGGAHTPEAATSTRLATLPRRPHAKVRPSSAAARQGQRIREALAATRAAEEDVVYWTNRVKMLKHEMDKVIVKIEEARRLNDITEVSAMLNERTRQALDEQREFQAKLLEARRTLNRQRRRELKERCWQARLGRFEENWGARGQLKAEQENHQRIIGQLRWEELQVNIKRKEEIQQQKMSALMRRVQERAEKESEAHRRFEDRIARTKAQEERKTQEALALIKESAVLMQHLQALKEEHVTVAGRVDPNLMAFTL